MGASLRLAFNGMGALVTLLNGYLHLRILREEFISRRYVIALSLMDLVVITAAIGATSGFGNTFFVFYYPALLILPLTLSSGRLSLGIVILTAAVYSVISFFVGQGVIVADQEERILVVRLATMFAVVGVAHLISRMERERRREAVEGEAIQWRRNMELQERTQKAELAAQEERSRIAREIHDGIAQSIYMLSLQLETCVDLAAKQREGLTQRLEQLVSLSKQTLLDVRYYIFDLKPFLAGDKNVVGMLENQTREFSRVAGIPAILDASGEPRVIPIPVATSLYRVAQEALANALKYSQASEVEVLLEFLSNEVRLTVTDNGKGFDPAVADSGYGLRNMRERAEELNGRFDLETLSDAGTKVIFSCPTDGD